MTDMEVWGTGTQLTMILGQQPGYITGLSIRGITCLYEVTYYHNGEYKSLSLVNECEFTVHEGTVKKKIGFKHS